MKKNILNMNKSNLIKVCMLVFFTSLLPLAKASAQQWTPKPLYYQESGALIEVGDSVCIHRDSAYYETGERKARFVYDKIHTVMQVGSKYHPEAVLLKEIYSWVEVGSLKPRNKAKMKPLPNPEPEPVDSVKEVEPITQEPEPAPVDSVEQVETDTIKSYQANRFSVGVRGGFASTLQDVGSFPLGYDLALDLRYAHYWGTDNKPQLGIMTGLGVAYVHTMHHMQLNDDYVLPTIHGDVRYTVNADNVVEKVNEIVLELPIMFSMVTTKGLFLNVGPKLMMPVYSKFHQTISNPVINAYKEELNGRPITNNIVMGLVSDEQANMKASLNNEYKFSLALGAELGYEFKLNNGHSIDLGAYLDYTVFNAYKNTDPATTIVTITPPNASDKAIVDVQSMTNAMSHQLGLFDVGLKVAYNFDFKK
jgi:hypothetical protein